MSHNVCLSISCNEHTVVWYHFDSPSCANQGPPIFVWHWLFMCLSICNRYTVVWYHFDSPSCTPTSPELMIMFQCLELYHQLRQHQSSFSIQAYTKVLCVLHGVSGFKSYVVPADLYRGYISSPLLQSVFDGIWCVPCDSTHCPIPCQPSTSLRRS